MEVNKLYVGNLSYTVTNERLRELFAGYGEVQQVTVIEGKGFGFVEMADPASAQAAKEALNGREFDGRTLKVDDARPPRDREPRRGGGGPRRGRPSY